MTPLPNFLCVGAPKTGTTALHEDLAAHPDIFLSTVKETHFFRLGFDGLPWGGPGTPPPMTIDTLTKYQQLFASASGHTAIGEICPSYFADASVAGHIRDTLGPVKIIILLRDPVTRAFSQFLHARLIGCEPEVSFLNAVALEDERRAAGWGEFWSYLGQSHYAAPLNRYIGTFGRENVLVLRHEHYVADRAASLRAIYGFLGVSVDVADAQAMPGRRVNASGVPASRLAALTFRHIESLAKVARRTVPAPLRHRVKGFLDRSLVKAAVTPTERAALLPRLQNDIVQLEQILGWDLTDWKQ